VLYGVFLCLHNFPEHRASRYDMRILSWKTRAVGRLLYINHIMGEIDQATSFL